MLIGANISGYRNREESQPTEGSGKRWRYVLKEPMDLQAAEGGKSVNRTV